MEHLQDLIFVLTSKSLCQLQVPETENAVHLPTGVERKVDMEYIQTEDLVPLEDPKIAAEVAMLVIYTQTYAHRFIFAILFDAIS